MNSWIHTLDVCAVDGFSEIEIFFTLNAADFFDFHSFILRFFFLVYFFLFAQCEHLYQKKKFFFYASDTKNINFLLIFVSLLVEGKKRVNGTFSQGFPLMIYISLYPVDNL